MIARATRRRVIRIPLTKALAKFSIDHIPGVFRLLRIPFLVYCSSDTTAMGR